MGSMSSSFSAPVFALAIRSVACACPYKAMLKVLPQGLHVGLRRLRLANGPRVVRRAVLHQLAPLAWRMRRARRRACGCHRPASISHRSALSRSRAPVSFSCASVGGKSAERCSRSRPASPPQSRYSAAVAATPDPPPPPPGSALSSRYPAASASPTGRPRQLLGTHAITSRTMKVLPQGLLWRYMRSEFVSNPAPIRPLEGQGTGEL